MLKCTFPTTVRALKLCLLLSLMCQSLQEKWINLALITCVYLAIVEQQSTEILNGLCASFRARFHLFVCKQNVCVYKYVCVWTLIGASEQEFSRVTEAGVDGESVPSKTEAGEHGGQTHQQC